MYLSTERETSKKEVKELHESTILHLWCSCGGNNTATTRLYSIIVQVPTVVWSSHHLQYSHTTVLSQHAIEEASKKPTVSRHCIRYQRNQIPWDLHGSLERRPPRRSLKGQYKPQMNLCKEIPSLQRRQTSLQQRRVPRKTPRRIGFHSLYSTNARRKQRFTGKTALKIWRLSKRSMGTVLFLNLLKKTSRWHIGSSEIEGKGIFLLP